jgi:myosin heavy subunit
MVLRQLQYTGMLETIRIRREGFAHRMPFAELIEAYQGLAFPFSAKKNPTRQNAEELLTKCQALQEERCAQLNLASHRNTPYTRTHTHTILRLVGRAR